MSIGWFVDARRARRVEGVPDGTAPRALETRVVRETRATYLDRGTVGEGVGVRHAELDDVRAGLVQDRERLLGGVEVGIARADEGHERALVAPLQGSEGLADGRGGRGSVGGGAHRRGARGAARRDGRARCELDAREGGGGEGGGGHRGSSEDDRRGCGVGEGLELQGRAWADVTCGAVPVCGRLCCPRRRSRRARRAGSRGFDCRHRSTNQDLTNRRS